MCYDNNKYVYVLMDEDQQGEVPEPKVIHDKSHDSDVAGELFVYKFNLENRSWEKLPNFCNLIHNWASDYIETYVYDLCIYENKLCIRTEGYLDRGGFNYLRVDAKEPDW